MEVEQIKYPYSRESYERAMNENEQSENQFRTDQRIRHPVQHHGSCPHIVPSERSIPLSNCIVHEMESYPCPLMTVCDHSGDHVLCEYGEEVLDILGFVPYRLSSGTLYVESYHHPRDLAYIFDGSSVHRLDQRSGDRYRISSVEDLLEDIDAMD